MGLTNLHISRLMKEIIETVKGMTESVFRNSSYTSYLENILGTEMCIKFESEEILTTGNDCIKSDSKDNEVRSFALPADEAIYFDCQQG